jgi:hypothetical protein
LHNGQELPVEQQRKRSTSALKPVDHEVRVNCCAGPVAADWKIEKPTFEEQLTLELTGAQRPRRTTC